MMPETREERNGFEIVQDDVPPVASTTIASLPPPSALPSIVMDSVPNAPPIDPPPTSSNPFTVRPPLHLNSQRAEVSPTKMEVPSSKIDIPMSDVDPTHSSNPNMFNWLQKTVTESQFLTKVAEKARMGMDTMITTFDPQMKEYLDAEGSIELAIASDCQVEINSIKSGFQRIFQNAHGRGLGAPGAKNVSLVVQPVGFAVGRQKHIPIVATENLLVEIEPNQWFDLACVILDDPKGGIQLHVFTQMTPVNNDVIDVLKRHTPVDYAEKSRGFAITTGQAMAEWTGVAEPDEWHSLVTGLTRRDLINNASTCLAFLYKQKLAISAHQF